MHPDRRRAGRRIRKRRRLFGRTAQRFAALSQAAGAAGLALSLFGTSFRTAAQQEAARAAHAAKLERLP